jgi:DNA-binding CsgD family transcriptional regulator
MLFVVRRRPLGRAGLCVARRIMNDRDGFVADEIIEVFCKAATRPELWTGALQTLADAFHADGWVLKPWPSSFRAPIWSPSLDHVLNHAMREGWIDNDVRLERCLAAFAKGRDIVTESIVFTPLELDHLPYNADFINCFDRRWFAAMTLAGEGPSSFVLELQRPTTSGPFAKSDIDMLGRLLPHLREAANSALRLSQIFHKTLLGAFGAFKCGVVLLDWKGRIVDLGPKQEVILGPALCVRRGFLRASTSESDASLRKLIHLAIGQESIQEHNNPSVVAVPRLGTSPLLVQAIQLVPPCTGRFFARAALMIVDRATQHMPDIPDLRRIFGLTASESEIAVAFANGEDIESIAKARGVSPGTLRVQLRSIFDKTNTRRQAELVGLLLRYATLLR